VWVAYVAGIALELISSVGFRVSHVAILDGLLEVITGVAEALGVGGAVRKVSSNTCFSFQKMRAKIGLITCLACGALIPGAGTRAHILRQHVSIGLNRS
jgi:hypothetical protein